MRRVLMGGAALAVMAACVLAAPAQAQDAAPVATATTLPELVDGKRVFQPAFFEAERPQSALDMVNRIPGFGIDEGDDVRGFGANAGNVLIDGARPTTKGQSLRDLLSRLPAPNVERIELLEGAAAGALAPGKTQVVNVVRKASAKSGGTYKVQADLYSNGFLRPELETSYTLRRGAWNITAGAKHEVENYQNLTGYEGLRDAAGAFLEQGPNDDRRRSKFTELSLAVDGRLAGTKLSANASGFNADRSRRWTAVATRTGATLPYRVDEGLETGERTSWSAGADAERDILGWTAKLAVLANSRDDSDLSRAGFNLVGAPLEFSRFTADQTYSERIARATFKRAFGAHQIETGGEFALTALDFSGEFALGDGSSFIVIPGAIAATEVEENRKEAFISDSWTISPKLTAEGILTGEWSTISQSGDAAKERSFFYAKPKLKLTWKPGGGWTVRGEVERYVGQLDFGAFADSASVGEGNQNNGNPELRPEQAWVGALTLEKRWGQRGVFNASLSREEYEDKLTLVPVGTDGIALGNLGEPATRWGWNVSATVPLTMVLKGLEFSASARWRDSELLDPLTGRPRPFSGWNGNNLEVNLRHDIASKNLVWGLWFWRGDHNFEFRRDQEFEWGTNTFWGGWVQTKAIKGISIEVGFEDPGGNTFNRVRRDYLPDRRSGQLSGSQYRERSIDGKFYIEVKGSI